MIQSRMLWMLRPVDRSMTVSAPQRVAQTSLSTSSATVESTAELPMLALILVGGDGGGPAGHFLAHELGRREVRDRGAEIVAVTHARSVLFAAQVLADGDIFHLVRDDPGAGVFQLGDQLARLGAVDLAALVGKFRGQMLALGEAVVLGLHLARIGDDLDVATRHDEGLAGARQALLDVDGD